MAGLNATGCLGIAFLGSAGLIAFAHSGSSRRDRAGSGRGAVDRPAAASAAGSLLTTERSARE